MRQEEARLKEAIKLQAQLDEEVAKQIHLDKMIAKRMAEEEALTEQQKKRKAQLSQLKKLKFEEIKTKFDKLVRQIDTFVPINLEATKAKLKRYGEELQTKNSKKQKIDDKDVPAIGEKVVENAQAMNPTPLATKSNIMVNWKIFQQGQRSIYQIKRANRADTFYMSFGAMIKDFTREDLIELYRTMFDPPLNEDAIWSLLLQQKMYCTKALATPEQTATGKENSNLLIADSLLKTISCEEKTKTKRQSMIWFFKEHQIDHHSREAKDFKTCLDTILKSPN
ncbi:hypothetical protein Tco_1198783 [Tanacetum coccineum]